MKQLNQELQDKTLHKDLENPGRKKEKENFSHL